MDGKVVVIGSLNYDIILKTDRMPLKGETHTAESAQCGGGGKGGNQAVQCAKLGIPTYMAGHVGNDCYGDILRHTAWIPPMSDAHLLPAAWESYIPCGTEVSLPP